ncbi:hypothetical protein JEZ13_02035 [bacterium]|nr:hypothetical protein [bacterium]
MKNYVSLIILSLIFLLTIGCSKKNTPAVILVPGYGSKSILWEESGVIEKLVVEGYKYGGRVQSRDFIGKMKISPEFKQGDIYNFVFSDSIQTIEMLTNELSCVVRGLKKKTYNDRFIIVAYSMGGIISRNYLVNNIDKNHTVSLITISSPHLGSYLANVLYATTLIAGGSESVAAKSIIEMFGIHSAISLKTLKDLVSSGEDSFLYQLNSKPHPDNINYVSVIAHDIDDPESMSFRKILDRILWENQNSKGDTVVSAESQNMANIQYFTDNKFRLKHKEEHINASHLNACSQKDELSKIILNELNRFKVE